AAGRNDLVERVEVRDDVAGRRVPSGLPERSRDGSGIAHRPNDERQLPGLTPPGDEWQVDLRIPVGPLQREVHVLRHDAHDLVNVSPQPDLPSDRTLTEEQSGGQAPM